jgi:hypothetical protein
MADQPFEPTYVFGEDANKSRHEDRLKRVKALAAMHAVPRNQRKAMGLPLTDKAFAQHWGVVPGRLTKDKRTDEYEKFLDEAIEQQAQQIDPRGTAALTESKLAELANTDLETYQMLKGALAQEAMAGEHKALELWLRLWGQPFIEEEVKRVDVVANLDDVTLAKEVISLVGADLIRELLDGER